MIFAFVTDVLGNFASDYNWGKCAQSFNKLWIVVL